MNGRHWLPLAGRSNNAPLAPELYERVWRPRSLALLTGIDFPLTRELDLIREGSKIATTDLVVDLGTSTGIYARGLARASGARAQIVALDPARGMLAFAQCAGQREGLKNISFLRALAQRSPFADASVDAIVCGGSLNEFRSMAEALSEMRRVLKPERRIVTMSLLAASSMQAKLAQRLFGLSGIRFPTREAIDARVREAGLGIVRHETFGVVTFCRIEHEPQPDPPQTALPIREVLDP